jgi:hypothetical protein
MEADEINSEVSQIYMFAIFANKFHMLKNSSNFLDTTLCNSVKVNRTSACYLPHTGFLLGLLFGPDDGGDIFIRNVG